MDFHSSPFLIINPSRCCPPCCATSAFLISSCLRFLYLPEAPYNESGLFSHCCFFSSISSLSTAIAIPFQRPFTFLSRPSHNGPTPHFTLSRSINSNHPWLGRYCCRRPLLPRSNSLRQDIRSPLHQQRRQSVVRFHSGSWSQKYRLRALNTKPQLPREFPGDGDRAPVRSRFLHWRYNCCEEKG